MEQYDMYLKLNLVTLCVICDLRDKILIQKNTHG